MFCSNNLLQYVQTCDRCTFYIMQKRNKRTLIPLKLYKYVMIISRRKRSYECRCSRFSSLLLVFLRDLLLFLLSFPLMDLLLVSLNLTFAASIIFYTFLWFFFDFFYLHANDTHPFEIQGLYLSIGDL